MTVASERRKAQRRPILDTFSLFIVIPKKGVHRLQLHDLSEDGLGFDFDTLGEALDVPIGQGEILDIQFYLNQSLYVPLAVQVARVEQVSSVRRIGAKFHDKRNKNYKAFLSFVQMLDAITDIAKIENEKNKSKPQ